MGRRQRQLPKVQPIAPTSDIDTGVSSGQDSERNMAKADANTASTGLIRYLFKGQARQRLGAAGKWQLPQP